MTHTIITDWDSEDEDLLAEHMIKQTSPLEDAEVLFSAEEIETIPQNDVSVRSGMRAGHGEALPAKLY